MKNYQRLYTWYYQQKFVDWSLALHYFQEDFKTQELPLARIKKIMRLEDDIAEAGTPRFMIAAEAPIVIAKACEIFVLEVSHRNLKSIVYELYDKDRKH